MYGISAAFDDSQTPDFSLIPTALSGPQVGVAGVASGGVPAVFGDSGILADDLTAGGLLCPPLERPSFSQLVSRA